MPVTRRWIRAKAKEQLDSVVADVEQRAERYVIEEEGKPVAAVVSLADLERLQDGKGAEERRRGPLALVGLWGDVPDDEIDAVMNEIYESRRRDTGRPVELDED